MLMVAGMLVALAVGSSRADVTLFAGGGVLLADGGLIDGVGVAAEAGVAVDVAEYLSVAFVGTAGQSGRSGGGTLGLLGAGIRPRVTACLFDGAVCPYGDFLAAWMRVRDDRTGAEPHESDHLAVAPGGGVGFHLGAVALEFGASYWRTVTDDRGLRGIVPGARLGVTF
jgi:hypothetical protein